MTKTAWFASAAVGLIAAAMAPAAAWAVDTGASSPGAGDAALGEVVVTAEKKTEKLSQAPVSADVVTAQTFEKTNLLSLRDYGDSIPGLDIYSAGAGFVKASIRGVETDLGSAPTVGFYIDDIPYGANTPNSGLQRYGLDLAPFDIDQIEVLKGPQGTLYGSNAIGGAIKYDLKKPDLDNYGADLRTGLSATRNGGANYDVAGAGNIPLVKDVLAIRVSGYESHDDGYIRNINPAFFNQLVNGQDVYGGRFDLLFKPNDKLSVRLGALVQDINRDSDGLSRMNPDGTPTYGSFLNADFAIKTPFQQRINIYSATINYDLGFANLSSITSYQKLRQFETIDETAVYVPILQEYYNRNYGTVGLVFSSDTKALTQEVRLASKTGGRLEWVVGGFFSTSTSNFGNDLPATFPSGAAAPDDIDDDNGPSHEREMAGFGSLTYHVTGKIDVTGGIRYSHYSQDDADYGEGILFSPLAKIKSNGDAPTYLLTASYKFDKSTMAYARFSTGYRPGGPNALVLDPTTGKPFVPPSYGPDKVYSYEAGVKWSSKDGRYSIDADVYVLDWINMQVGYTSPEFTGGTVNLGPDVIGKGVEIAFSARPTKALTLSGSFAAEDIHVTGDSVFLDALKGEQLPTQAPYSGALDAQYVLSDHGVRPAVGAALRYKYKRKPGFELQSTYPQMPAYTIVDLRAGITVKGVDLQAYVHNVGDSGGPLHYDYIGQYVPATPRTVGVSASAHF